jgi:hypothetical protein
VAQLTDHPEEGVSIADMPAIRHPGWSHQVKLIEYLLALNQGTPSQVLTVEVQEIEGRVGCRLGRRVEPQFTPKRKLRLSCGCLYRVYSAPKSAACGCSEYK